MDRQPGACVHLGQVAPVKHRADVGNMSLSASDPTGFDVAVAAGSGISRNPVRHVVIAVSNQGTFSVGAGTHTKIPIGVSYNSFNGRWCVRGIPPWGENRECPSRGDLPSDLSRFDPAPPSRLDGMPPGILVGSQFPSSTPGGIDGTQPGNLRGQGQAQPTSTPGGLDGMPPGLTGGNQTGGSGG